MWNTQPCTLDSARFPLDYCSHICARKRVNHDPTVDLTLIMMLKEIKFGDTGGCKPSPPSRILAMKSMASLQTRARAPSPPSRTFRDETKATPVGQEQV